MTLSEQIAHCKKCKEFAQWIDPKNPGDLFQEAWLDIWEFEQKNPKKAAEVKSFQRYFYRALKLRHWKRVKQTANDLNIDWVDERNVIEFEGDDVPSEAFLIEWINEVPRNEIHLFYKNIITLVLRCKNTEDAIKIAHINRTKFYAYLKDAKQQLKHDYHSTANLDNVSDNSLV